MSRSKQNAVQLGGLIMLFAAAHVASAGDITIDPWDPSYTGPADPNGWMSLKDYGYPGAYYYIGNEDMSAAGGSLEGAANLFVQHAQVMEAVDPELTFGIVNIEDEVIHTLKLKKSQLSFSR